MVTARRHDVDQCPVAAKTVCVLFQAAKKIILQDMAIVRDLPGFRVIAKLPGLQDIFFSKEFDLFRTQVVATHAERRINLTTMERMNPVVRMVFILFVFLNLLI